jgi:multidrug resistance protein MdtO
LSVFRRDAWTNHDHIQFALKGCLAASTCYVFYSAIGWPGLNTSVATCIVTALSSVGSSRQKQILRFTGALTGGVILGMGAQIVLLPNIDSITGFTLLFAAVTAIAAWFSTASARLSYFGLQIALAFFLINLQEFAFQTSLTIARDRVFGILLGLFVMWLVFDLIGGVRAADQILRSFRQIILRLAELQELSLAPDAQAIAQRVQVIREELVGLFAAVNTEADAVLLETGTRRDQDLHLRSRVLALQPSLRSLLLLQVTHLQYRRERLLHELPDAVAAAQRGFDEAMTSFLRELAAKYPTALPFPTLTSFQILRDAIHEHYNSVAGGVLSVSARAVITLSESMVDIAQAIASSGTSEPQAGFAEDGSEIPANTSGAPAVTPN